MMKSVAALGFAVAFTIALAAPTVVKRAQPAGIDGTVVRNARCFFGLLTSIDQCPATRVLSIGAP